MTSEKEVKYNIERGRCPFDGNDLIRHEDTDDLLPRVRDALIDTFSRHERGDMPYSLDCPGCGNLFTPSGFVVDQNLG